MSPNSSFTDRLKIFFAARSDDICQSDDAVDTFSYTVDSKEQTMNKTVDTTTPSVAFKTVHYVYGTDVTNMSANELLYAVKSVETEIASLDSVKTKSAYVVKRKAELNEMLVKIVEHLDAKA